MSDILQIVLEIKKEKDNKVVILLFFLYTILQVLCMEWARLELLLKDNLKIVQNKNILVIGIGGVGGYVVESLARLGIKKIIIVDGDVVDMTNINRQIIALHSTVGKPKVEVFKERIFDINPRCEVIDIYEFLTPDRINDLITNQIDYVVDACDTTEVKKEIIRVCSKKEISFITCMGTGNKLDPSKLEITDIRKTEYDPLAKIIRKMVRDEKIVGKVPVVCSKERPIKHDSNVVASCSFVPSVAGLLCTSYIVNDIVGDMHE